MSEAERNGHRRSRGARFDRCNLRLGNYLIITDAKKNRKTLYGRLERIIT